jgi:hypothetical protein
MVKQKDGRLTAKSLNILMERRLKIVKFMLFAHHTPLNKQVIIKTLSVVSAML